MAYRRPVVGRFRSGIFPRSPPAALELEGNLRPALYRRSPRARLRALGRSISFGDPVLLAARALLVESDSPRRRPRSRGLRPGASPEGPSSRGGRSPRLVRERDRRRLVGRWIVRRP